LGDQIKENVTSRACSKHGRDEKYNISVEEPEGKRPFGRPRQRWEDNTMDFREIG
jgi:hypothetical protein